MVADIDVESQDDYFVSKYQGKEPKGLEGSLRGQEHEGNSIASQSSQKISKPSKAPQKKSV